MNVASKNTEKTILVTFSVAFVFWSLVFIYKSSFLGIDGKRYFSLFDDAMISMRYAWNFSHGLGLVWNQGEYVQGYTNLLMTLFMSFATLVFDKSTAVLSIQLMGVGVMLAVAYVNMQIAKYIVDNKIEQTREFIKLFSFCCALIYYPLAYWTLMGMETGLLTLLLLLGVLFAFRYIEAKNSLHLFLVSVVLGLAFLTRSDSFVFAVLVWLYIAWETFIPTSKFNAKVFKLLLTSIGLYIGIAVGQLIFQYLYYGAILPNTYTLKLAGMPLPTRLANGLRFVTPFLNVSAFILVLSSLELVFDFQKKKLLLLSIVFSAIGYEICVGGDPWNYWRILTPSMPLAIILFVSAIHVMVSATSNTEVFRLFFLRKSMFPENFSVQVLVIPLVLIGLFSANSQFFREILFLDKPYTVDDNQRNVNRAIALRKLTTNDATVGVIWAGSTPYYVDRKAIDFLGKSDRYIAELHPDLSGAVAWFGMNSVPGHNKYDLNYSIKILLPTYVPNFKYGQQDLSRWAEDKYIRVEYESVELFLLKDSPHVYWDKINVP